MNSPLVSVIIPCYNAEKYVEEAVRSIMNQSYKNLEIIVTDDCSSDNTLMILETLAVEDARIKVIKNKENLKIVKSLNNMIEIAQGKYIARMDADDISLPERIEKQVNFMEENPEYGVCGTNAWIIDENGKYLSKSILPINYNDIKELIHFKNPVYHPSILGLRSIFIMYKYKIEYQHAEDYELWNRLIKNKIKITNLSSILLKYRSYSLQTSVSYSDNQKSLVKNIISDNSSFEDSFIDCFISFINCKKIKKGNKNNLINFKEVFLKLNGISISSYFVIIPMLYQNLKLLFVDKKIFIKFSFIFILFFVYKMKIKFITIYKNRV